MTQSETTAEAKAERRTSPLDFAFLLARYRKLVLGLPLAAGFVALIVVFLLPKWYTATTRIMPPQQSQSNAVAILGQLGALSGGASQALGLKNPSDIYVAMLKSRTVADNLVQRFGLSKIYDYKFLEDTRKELARNSSISATKEGVIIIEVDDQDPTRAAAIANAYADELRQLTVRLAVSEAGQRRLFFESQVNKTKDDLASAELTLKKFVQETGMVNPESQVGLTVAVAAALRAQISTREVQLAAIRTFATGQNPEVIRINQEIAGLRAELGRMEKGVSVGKGDVFISMGIAPEIGLEYMRRLRDVKYFEALYGALGKQYEIARIDEAKDATLIQVLDSATPPEKKSKPRRALIVAVVTVGALFLASIAALVHDLFKQASKDPKTASQLRELQDLMRFRRIRSP